MTRVLCDRLVDTHDRDFFHSQLRKAVETHFGVDYLNMGDVVFGDFSRNRGEPEYIEHQPSHVKNLLKVAVDDGGEDYVSQVVFLGATVSRITLDDFIDK